LGKYFLPKEKIPKLLSYLIGPSQGLSWKYVNLNAGIPIKFENSYFHNFSGRMKK